MDEKLLYRIGLSLVKGIGPKLARNLIAYIGDEEEVFKTPKQSLLKIPGIGSVLVAAVKDKAVLKRAEQELLFIKKHNISPFYFTDDAYPQRLSYCDDAPLMLFCKGVNVLGSKKVIGVVGTRRPTQEGKMQCERLVAELADHYPGAVIVSGLAYGIDISAHRAALKHGLSTYGVLAHGLDRIYPAMHRHTAAQMVERGGLLTEFLSETNPDRPNFVRRNRIIAGLCDALVVVESGVKGGALITARIAHSYNRDVLAFPGCAMEDSAKGCNYLIKKNIAALIENVEDLEYALGWEKELNKKPQQAQLFVDLNTEEEHKLYQAMVECKELTANELSLRCGLPISKVSSTMLTLEFSGLVKCLPGNAFRLLQ